MQPELEKEFPFWDKGRLKEAGKQIAISALVLGGLSYIGATVPIDKEPTIVKIALYSTFVIIPAAFSKEMLNTVQYGFALLLPNNSLVRDLKIQDENNRYYRNNQFFASTARIRELLSSDRKEGYIGLGAVAFLTQELANFLLRPTEGEQLSTSVLDSIKKTRRNYSDIKLGLTDLYLYFDPQTGTPKLVVASRLKENPYKWGSEKEDNDKKGNIFPWNWQGSGAH